LEADDDDKWAGDAHDVDEDDDGEEDEEHLITWVDDGHEESDDGGNDSWGDDGHQETDDGGDDTWGGDGHQETDDGGDDTWGDDGDEDDDNVVDDGWNGDGYEKTPEEKNEGDDAVDSWGDDDATADRQPTTITESLIEEEDAHHVQDSKSVPIGAIAGAAAAASVAALVAFAVIRRRNQERFEDKDSIATSITPPPEARMARDGDIEIDHTFFDEHQFQLNYQEQELAYQDLYPHEDLSTVNEDLGTGDDASI
jgi:hypothetical protein